MRPERGLKSCNLTEITWMLASLNNADLSKVYPRIRTGEMKEKACVKVEVSDLINDPLFLLLLFSLFPVFLSALLCGKQCDRVNTSESIAEEHSHRTLIGLNLCTTKGEEHYLSI